MPAIEKIVVNSAKSPPHSYMPPVGGAKSTFGGLENLKKLPFFNSVFDSEWKREKSVYSVILRSLAHFA